MAFCIRVLPSTQAGLALVVPAIWPFLQAQRAVCRAMVLRGWLLSLSNVTISQVPAANWPTAHTNRVKSQKGRYTMLPLQVTQCSQQRCPNTAQTPPWTIKLTSWALAWPFFKSCCRKSRHIHLHVYSWEECIILLILLHIKKTC